jgi:DNA-binding response OmpR family regulator
MAKKILIVEDDTFLQGLAATKLTKEGFAVIPVGNGDDAAKAIDESTPDLVLLDLVLPGTDGYGVLKKIRENLKTHEIPVIVFSNLAQEADIKKAKDLGANDFMIKSNFTLDELAEKIKGILKM